MEQHVNHSPPPDDLDEPEGRWFVSVAFWLSLLLAAGLYGCVALSPKLHNYLVIDRDHRENQQRLVAIQQHLAYLDRVHRALEEDPQFAAELARIDFDAARPGDERIAVDPSLSLDALSADPLAELPPQKLPWYAPLVARFATHQRLRHGALAAAAVIILLSFMLLQESQTPQLRSAGRTVKSLCRRVADRYRKQDA